MMRGRGIVVESVGLKKVVVHAAFGIGYWSMSGLVGNKGPKTFESERFHGC